MELISCETIIIFLWQIDKQGCCDDINKWSPVIYCYLSSYEKVEVIKIFLRHIRGINSDIAFGRRRFPQQCLITKSQTLLTSIFKKRKTNVNLGEPYRITSLTMKCRWIFTGLARPYGPLRTGVVPFTPINNGIIYERRQIWHLKWIGPNSSKETYDIKSYQTPLPKYSLSLSALADI